MKTLLTIGCAIALLFTSIGTAQAADCGAMMDKYKEKPQFRRLKSIEKCYKSAIAQNPDVAANYYGLAQVKYRQGKFRPAYHQLELARRHNPTKKELCDIESLAIWLAPKSISSLQKMARVCRKVDPGKAEMARAFIKAKAMKLKNMYSPMRKKLGENIARVENGMTEEQVVEIIGFEPDYKASNTRRGIGYVCLEWFYDPIPAYDFDGKHYWPKGKKESVGLENGLVYTKKPCSIFER